MSSIEPGAGQELQAAFSERLYIYRLALPMSREELANKAHLSIDELYRLEQGWDVPSELTVRRLAAALRTTRDELMNGAGR